MESKVVQILVSLGIIMVANAVNHQAEVDKLNQDIEELARHLMLQQQFVEERIRSDGNSGVKQIRGTHKGSRSYFSDTINMGSVLSIHDHTNYDRTIGMGEFIGVLNGVEFRTRHNDYKLRMPSRNSSTFNLLENVPFPEVPPSVKAKHNVPDQINEMREYFRAFKEQNASIRHDYADYFKPVLCYLEGAWTTDTKSLSEPFHSDRHYLDASSWFDLLEKVRFTSYTGGKSNNENYSFLPTAITDVRNGTPSYAQWNYRIVCHPIKTRLDLGTFGLLDDLSVRMAHRWDLDHMFSSRSARFHLNPYNTGRDYNKTHGAGKLSSTFTDQELLDVIMLEIPGKDNYPGRLHDDSFGQTELTAQYRGNIPLNTAYYHRWSKSKQANALGEHISYKGFSDNNLFVAETTQPRIAPSTVKSCHLNASTHAVACTEHTARYSYAVPLEIIWMTPLYKWNPYNLAFHEHYADVANIITKGGRDGGTTAAKAFNGTGTSYYYYTPNDFFKSNEVGRDPADTAKDVVGVLDRQGHVRLVKPAGTRIILPEIEGVGKIRTRYPIPPSHHEGNAMYKEVDALKDIILNMPDHGKYFHSPPFASEHTQVDNNDHIQHFTTTFTHHTPPGLHQHDLYLDKDQQWALSHGHPVNVITSSDNEHQHILRIQRDSHDHNAYKILSCDDSPHCFDGHANYLMLQAN